MIERIQLNTRHYAKRQLTWFRPNERIEWIPATGQNARALADEIQHWLAKLPND